MASIFYFHFFFQKVFTSAKCFSRFGCLFKDLKMDFQGFSPCEEEKKSSRQKSLPSRAKLRIKFSFTSPKKKKSYCVPTIFFFFLKNVKWIYIEEAHQSRFSKFTKSICFFFFTLDFFFVQN